MPSSVNMNNLYHEKFLEKGYDDLETISTLSTKDLKSIIGVGIEGHIRKFEIAIKKLKKEIGEVEIENTTSRDITAPTVPAFDVKRQSTILFSKGGKFVKLDTGTNSIEYP